MTDRKSPEQIKSAVSEVLNQVVIGSKGGTIDGSLTITGDGNYLKAPDVLIGTTSVSKLIENSGVKTINGQSPDSAGNVTIDAGVTSVNGHSGAVTQAQLGCLPLTGGKLTGNVIVTSSSWTQTVENSTSKNIEFRRDGYDGGYYLRAFDFASWRQIIDNSGGQTIGGNLTSTGWMYASGFKATSDARLKENITKTHYDLSSISTYHYKLKTDGENHVGLLAQEVEKVIPEAVSEDEKGIKHLDYNAVVSALVSEVNLLKEEIKKLKASK